MDSQNALDNLLQNNTIFAYDDTDTDESFEFDELESKLEEELALQMEELDLLKEEKEQIGSPDALGETIKGIVWEQFINQIAVTAGEDFIKENNGLTLDLRNSAHIQTADNFEQGNIATHNHISREQLEYNYDRYKNTSHKEFRKNYVQPGMDATLKRAGELNKQGVKTVKDIYTGKQIPTASKRTDGTYNPDAAQREHVNPSAKLYQDSSLQMANDNQELANIINHPDNLQGYTTAERNNRKSDHSSDEMNEKDKTKHYEKAKEKSDKYIEQEKKKGEERLKQEGRQTQKEEAFRMGGKALRAVLMQMLAELVKEIIGKLVKWFKEAERNLKTLLASVKEAILAFISKLKTHLINAGNTAVTTIATAIVGPVFGLIKKVWSMLKQGWKALKDAVAFLKDPQNKSMPFDRKILEVGKILIAGLTGVGAILLGEVIEKGLTAIPVIGAVFAFEIPLLGSLASLLGIFLGAVVAGIIGAIAINLIQKRIEKSQKDINTSARLNKGNDILETQEQLLEVYQARTNHEKMRAGNAIAQRHQAAAEIIKDAVRTITQDVPDNEEFDTDIDDMNTTLNDLMQKKEDNV